CPGPTSDRQLRGGVGARKAPRRRAATTRATRGARVILRFGTDFTTIVIASIVMVMALIFHNMVQSWVANRLGDPSPRLAGFMAFDPTRHLDPIGVVFLLLLGFGWPRTVPVNSRNYSRRGRSEAWVWVSGIGAYLVVAFLSMVVAAVFRSLASPSLFNA